MALILFFSCKFQISDDPKPWPYESIRISKKNGAFISEYVPQAPYLKMGGKNYKVNEAWVEHTHVKMDFYDSITPNAALVVDFYYNTSLRTDLKKYVKEMGNGVSTIWFNLSPQDYVDDSQIKDTLIIQYRESLDSVKKNRTFLLFKKRM
ncbi:MAG: hypothetical protein ABUL44_01150 [Flavobacterium sp.]